MTTEACVQFQIVLAKQVKVRTISIQTLEDAVFALLESIKDQRGRLNVTIALRAAILQLQVLRCRLYVLYVMQASFH